MLYLLIKAGLGICIIHKSFVYLYCNTNLIKKQNLIKKNLWLGSKYAALNNNFLLNNNIKLIINISKDIEFTNLNIEKYRISSNDDLTDSCRKGLANHFNTVYNLIDNKLDNDEGVLIHCLAGMQRSATLTAMYLMKKNKLKLNETINYIRSKRWVAFQPVPHYKLLLKDFSNTI